MATRLMPREPSQAAWSSRQPTVWHRKASLQRGVVRSRLGSAEAASLQPQHCSGLCLPPEPHVSAVQVSCHTSRSASAAGPAALGRSK